MMTTGEIRDLLGRLGREMFGPRFPAVTVDADSDMVMLEGRQGWTIRRDDDVSPVAWVIDRAEPYPGTWDEPPGVDVAQVSRHALPTQAIAFLVAEYARGLAFEILQGWDLSDGMEEMAF
jgi:hypothetical protein